MNFHSLLELMEYFKTEQDCIKYLYERRIKNNIKCPYCNCHCCSYLPKNSNRIRCKKCKSLYSVRIGTIFQDSNIPLRKWFIAMYIYLSYKKGILTIYNFINISSKDIKGHNIMNNFLKILTTNAKEKGEVFTPDHIANLMYKIAECSKDNIILDPTCGSGTFLLNAMINIFSETTNHEEQKNIRENQLIGIEVNAFNSTLAGMNMMLHGDSASNIYLDNCFTKIKELQNCYDRVLMNPPFSVKDKELKFVLVSLWNIKDDGILAVILPKTCSNNIHL